MYKTLAHPQSNGFVRPTTLKERLMHVTTAKRSLGSTIPWLVDAMDNRLKHAMGGRPNSEFIIAPDGRIVRMRDWSNPTTLRDDLTELVGEVENPTDPRSLNIRINFEQTEVARGVVERLRPEGRLVPFHVETKQTSLPAYVKLRAEGDSNGKLYLGFFVDPIHKVHWNNQAGPVQVDIDGRTLTGPVVEAKADADPREFLVEVGDGPISVTLRYVACDDEETWCNQVTQKFVVTQKPDPDAGRVNGRENGGSRRGSGRNGTSDRQGFRFSPGR